MGIARIDNIKGNINNVNFAHVYHPIVSISIDIDIDIDRYTIDIPVTRALQQLCSFRYSRHIKGYSGFIKFRVTPLWGGHGKRTANTVAEGLDITGTALTLQ